MTAVCYPEYGKKLIPGKLGVCNISLFPFSMHILSLLNKSMINRGKEYEIIGIHWRGGEEDTTRDHETLSTEINKLYCDMTEKLNFLLKYPPIVFHRLCCDGRMNLLDDTGSFLANMNYINDTFESISNMYGNVSVFDVREYPLFIPNNAQNGIFLEDNVHYTPDVNIWVAEKIFQNYYKSLTKPANV